MHVPDGFLDAQTSIGTGVLAAGVVAGVGAAEHGAHLGGIVTHDCLTPTPPAKAAWLAALMAYVVDATDPRQPRYTSHHVTCPNASAHRSSAKRAAA